MGKYKKLVAYTIIESAALQKTSKFISSVGKSAIKKKAQEKATAKTRDWLVNKSQGAEQRGTSNRVTSGNVTTNDMSNFNKERSEQINYNATQQGQPPVWDDDKHNEQVTQTNGATTKDSKAANTKRFSAKVKTSTKVSDLDSKKKKSINNLASVKSSARGVLGSIVTNM